MSELDYVNPRDFYARHPSAYILLHGLPYASIRRNLHGTLVQYPNLTLPVAIFLAHQMPLTMKVFQNRENTRIFDDVVSELFYVRKEEHKLVGEYIECEFVHTTQSVVCGFAVPEELRGLSIHVGASWVPVDREDENLGIVHELIIYVRFGLGKGFENVRWREICSGEELEGCREALAAEEKELQEALEKMAKDKENAEREKDEKLKKAAKERAGLQYMKVRATGRSWQRDYFEESVKECEESPQAQLEVTYDYDDYDDLEDRLKRAKLWERLENGKLEASISLLDDDDEEVKREWDEYAVCSSSF